MASWESYLGNIGSGALAGSTAGPVGAIVGGLGGLFGTLFGGDEKRPQFEDPYKAMREYAIGRLSTDNLGAKQASLASGQAMNLARDQMEQASNNPNFASNAAALSGINNNILRSAERGSAEAYLKGAQIDQGSRLQAAQLATQGSQLAQQQFQLNQAYKDRPTFGEQMFGNLLSTGAGYGLSTLLNTQSPQGAQPDKGAQSPTESTADFYSRMNPRGLSMPAPVVPKTIGAPMQDFTSPAQTFMSTGLDIPPSPTPVSNTGLFDYLKNTGWNPFLSTGY